MKNLLLTICLIMAIVLQANCQAPVIDWQKSYGGTGSDAANAIVATSDGGFIMAGYASSNDGDITGLHNGLYPQDFWIVKISNSGTIQWQKALGGSSDDYAESIIQTTDGGYIVAGHSSSNDGDATGWHHGNLYASYDYWVVKLSSTGVVQWQRSYGGLENELAYSIVQASDGGYIIAGIANQNDGDVTGNHGGNDFWIVKLYSDGIIQWKKSFGGTDQDVASSIIQTADGGFAVTGYTSSNNGDVTGFHGALDFWVVKMSSSGVLQWQKSLGGTGSESANSIIQTTDGGFMVAGSTGSNNNDVSGNHGGNDGWLVKLSSTGALQWQKTYGGTADDLAQSIVQTTDGGYVFSGNTYSNNGDVTANQGLSDYWIVKINSMGVIEWQRSIGGTGYDHYPNVVPTSDGKYILAGTSGSNNGNVTGNHGNNDIWVAKLSIAPFSISPTKKFVICQSTATITSTGCSGTVNWYRDVDGSGATNQFLASGNTLTYTADANWRQYIRATCTFGGVTTPLSNYCTVQTGPEIDPISYIVTPNTPITLYASGCPTGTTYLWATGETTQSITKSPSIYTLYFVRCVSNTCQSADAVAYISVGNVVANNDAYTLNVDTPLSANFNTNDGALSPKTIYVDFPPIHGSVVWDNNGAFTYTPASNYTGPDSFTYYLTNGVGGYSNYATVTLNIICPTTLPLSSTNSPSDNFNAGVHKRQASYYNGTITATNKITGTANVNYFAKKIELNAGFKAENGTVFNAQVGGCY